MQIQSETGYCYASSSIGGANVLDSFCRKVQEMSLKLVGPKCDPEQILVANASAVQRGTISDYQNAHSIEMNHERTCVDTLWVV